MSNLSDVIFLVKYVDGDGDCIKEDCDDYRFWCPGCDEVHGIRARGPKPCWTFNGDLVKPTFSPSHLTGWHGDNGEKFSEHRCHSFIENGNIRFLNDCHHELKGQTVPLPPKKEWRYGC
ncbi:MAG: DUF6527 family protein [Dehalococcoidia bacterium]